QQTRIEAMLENPYPLSEGQRSGLDPRWIPYATLADHIGDQDGHASFAEMATLARHLGVTFPGVPASNTPRAPIDAAIDQQFRHELLQVRSSAGIMLQILESMPEDY